MLKLHLDGSMYLSSNLSARLRSLGLLTDSNSPTEDLYYYISECLARDTKDIIVKEYTAAVPADEMTSKAAKEDPVEEKIPIELSHSFSTHETQLGAATRINKLFGR